jgi:hypothetical protein
MSNDDGTVDSDPVDDPPAHDESTEPTAVGEGTFLVNPMPFDAPLEVKSQFFGGLRRSTMGVAVRRPGEAETVATGGRAPVAGAHNWVPIGPRNVGGRVRCLAIDPTDPRIMYAGPASGGIFKSRDAGETWFPLWHDEPSLSMGAIAISPSDPAVVWAGTGESSTGGGETIPPSGVWRSTDAGARWEDASAAQLAFGPSKVAALAVHPTNAAVCWAATDDGVFRTVDGGATWEHFGAGQAYSDVCIVAVGADLWVFLAMSGSQTRTGPPVTQHPAVVRIKDPSIAAVTLGGVDGAGGILPDFDPPAAANTFQLPTVPAGPGGNPLSTSPPADGKLAVIPRAGGVGPFMYAVWARSDRTLYRVFRISNLAAVDSSGNPNLRVNRLANHPGFATESQGEYNLAIAVNPTNADHIVFGMQEMYVNRSATSSSSQATDWLQAQNQFLYIVERGHHADHHQFAFAPRPPAEFDQGVGDGAMWLWDANDGGVSVSADWQVATAGYDGGQQSLPIPSGVATWRKRSHGISASQMYDLTQHPRLPSVIGAGFQDNGAFASTGGMSWDLLQTADGGFVAFDPDDPYRLLATYQSGITEVRYPARLRGAATLLRDGVQTGSWPRELTDGFRGSDRAPFVAETVFHPTRPGRVFNARRNRLYATRHTTGDRWIPEPIGCGVEIIHEPTAARATAGSIEVLDTPGAMAIGLLPQRNETLRVEDRRLGARVRTLFAEPFDIRNGEHLQFVVHSDDPGAAPVLVDITLTVGATLPVSASAAELSAYITAHSRASSSLTALPVVWPTSSVITLFTRETGRANTLLVDGTAAITALLNPVRVNAGADAGGAFGGGALPAVAFIEWSGLADLSNLRLSVTRNGRATRDIDFGADSLLGLQALAARLRDELAPDDILVATNDLDWGVRLTATAANGIAAVTGTGSTNFTTQPASPARSFSINEHRTFFFPTPLAPPPPSPPPSSIRIREQTSGNQTSRLPMTVAALGTADVSHLTSVEMVHAFRRHLGVAPANVNVRCDLDLNPTHATDWATSSEGVVTEVAFSPSDPEIAWAGDGAGRMYRSGDGGDVWTQVSPLPRLDAANKDSGTGVDAIAIHPSTPSTVLVGMYEEGAHSTPDAFLFRTTDDGVSWVDVGSDIHDANGHLVGIRAVEFDSSNPDRVYAGTDLGVWFSDDGGTSWRAFNEGLPNARVTDLAFEPRQRLLRAGLWGRGVYERHVGDEPAKDVRLHLRTTSLDDGWNQPVPGPAVDALVPRSVALDESPDIKQTSTDPRRGLVLDGVEFDEDVQNEPVRAGRAFIAVQVNNRGAFPTSTAHVALLWSPADDGPPVLPASLWDALAAGPLAAGANFGSWTAIGELAPADPQGVDHHIVAPGYPRTVIFGQELPAFEWDADVLKPHRRIGLLALARCDEDPIVRGPDNVFDLIHSEAKAAYRECDIVPREDDDRIVLRSTAGAGFTVAVVSGSGNAANGAAPFGLSVAGAPIPRAEFAIGGPYNLSPGTRAFRLRVMHNVTVTFAVDDPAIRNIGSAFADEVAAVINRSMIDVGIPVRSDGRAYANGFQDALSVTPLGGAQLTFAAGSTAAGRLGLATGVTRSAATNQSFVTPFASRGPFNLAPDAGNPRTLVCAVVIDALIQFPATTKEIPSLGAATARQVRAAINRQCREAGIGVVAERRRLGLALRRTPTEAVSSRVVTGGFGLGDLVVVSGAELAPGAAREALFTLSNLRSVDALEPSATNRLYLRSTNTGNVDVAAVRHRIFEVTPTPFALAEVGTTVNESRTAGSSGVAALTWDVPARASGSRVFVLAVADTPTDALDPTAAMEGITSLHEAHAFCVRHPNAALREFEVG